MRKFKNKKGFTIVELVVVIAVIGVLTAILVPTFVTLSKRAQVANMQSFVTNINKKLAMNASTQGKNATMHDAQLDAKEIGFDIEKITPFDGHDIIWDSDSDRFMLVKGDEIVLKDNSTELNSLTAKTKKKLFKVAKDANELSDGYSHYLAKNEKWESSLNGGTEKVKFEAGVDVGDNEGISEINYERPSESEGQDVIIRTNGGNLTINAKNDNVIHYGYADSVNIVDVATASYHENGTVKFLEVAAGHIVLESSSEVSAVHFTATGSGDDAKFENADGKKISIDLSKVEEEKLPSFSRDAVTIKENGTYVAEVKTESTEYIWLFGKGIKEQMVVTESTGAIAENGTLKTGVTAGAEEGSVAEQIANPAKRNDEGQLLDENDEVIDLTEVNLTKQDALENKAVVEEVASKEDVQIGATLFAGGTGTEADPFLVYDYETFMNISYFCNRPEGAWIYEPHYFEVCMEKTDNGVINCYGQTAAVDMCGSFDGKGVTFKNVNSQLFGYVLGDKGPLAGISEIKNLSVEFGDQNNGGLVYANDAKTLKLDSIYCSGYLEGGNSGSFIDYAGFDWDNSKTGFSVYINNCHSNMTLVGSGGAVGGFIGHCGGCDDTYITNSSFTGQISVSGSYYAAIVQGNIYIDGTQSTWTNPDGFTVKTIIQESGINPSKYSIFSCDKVDGCVRAVATMIVGPNGNGKERVGSYFCEVVMSEELNTIGSTINTTNIKYFDITSNSSVTSVTGITSDGKTFNLVNKYNGTHVDGASVKVVQYDALGNILKITTWDITPQD